MLVEQSAAMYGGPCINVTCIPTKSLAHSAALPCTVLRDAVYTHPTMSEALNDLFTCV